MIVPPGGLEDYLGQGRLERHLCRSQGHCGRARANLGRTDILKRPTNAHLLLARPKAHCLCSKARLEPSSMLKFVRLLLLAASRFYGSRFVLGQAARAAGARQIRHGLLSLNMWVTAGELLESNVS